jgi:hypothetical protein
MRLPNCRSDAVAQLGIVIFGASFYDFWPALDNTQFANSAREFEEALTDRSLIGDRDTYVLNLFDERLSPSDITNQIVDFVSDSKFEDIILYYCGHGSLTGDRKTYMVCLRTTREKTRASTGLKLRDLAHDLDEHLYGKRLHVVLDACYAGDAVGEFMDAGLDPLIDQNLAETFPRSGVSVFAATGSGDVALAKKGERLTLFTGALLEVIRGGIATRQHSKRLCWSEVCDQVRSMTRSRYGYKAPTPRIVSTRNNDGDITRIPFFTNRAFVADEKPIQAEIDESEHALIGTLLHIQERTNKLLRPSRSKIAIGFAAITAFTITSYFTYNQFSAKILSDRNAIQLAAAAAEQEITDRARHEFALREQAIQEREEAVKRQLAAAEEAVKEREAKEERATREAREQAASKQAATEQAARDQAAKERAAREQREHDEAAKKQAIEIAEKEKSEQLEKYRAVQAQREQDEAARKQAATAELAVKEQMAKDRLAQQAREQEEARKQAAFAERQSIKEQADREAAARCDQLATNPYDRNRLPESLGTPFGILRGQAKEAIDACKIAKEAYPSILRFAYQFARATQATDPKQAFALHTQLTRLQYPSSFDNLGGLYIQLSNDFRTATALYQRGTNLGDPDSMVSLADMIDKGHFTSADNQQTKLGLLCNAGKFGHQAAAAACAKEMKTEADRQAAMQFIGAVVGGALGAAVSRR